MKFYDKALEHMATQPWCGYLPEGLVSVEPTALAAIALLGGGRHEVAARSLDRLVRLQNDDGSLGIDATNRKPCWTTGWAVLAWTTALRATAGEASQRQGWKDAAARAQGWLLQVQGGTIQQDDVFAHDMTLRGWPWVESTHSWVEPTAINVLALKSVGESEHERTREAILLLDNRMLPGGGWNYGNTIVLGNTLRAHVEPTGLALAALADEILYGSRRNVSIAWLEKTLSEKTTPISLCYAIWGLSACSRRPAEADAWLDTAFERTMARDGSPYKLALILIAAKA